MKILSMQLNSPEADYCTQVLSKVSRTFAPTIRMLPKRLYLPVTVAYLLCRIADTVEDETSLSKQDKEKLLLTYADIFKQEETENKIKFLAAVAAIPDHNTDVSLTKKLDRVFSVAHFPSAQAGGCPRDRLPVAADFISCFSAI